MSGQANLGEIDWGPVRRMIERDRRIDSMLQIAIAVLSFVAITMIGSDGPLHRWGFVVGLASQPFWIIATWRARQWGILLLAIFYCGAWSQGIFNRF